MNAALRADAEAIMRSAIDAVLPDEAVRRALADFRPGRGRTLLVAAGKAAWRMAAAALEVLGVVDDGVVTDVQVIEHSETVGVGAVAVDWLPGRIVEAGSADVDGVSGATITSDAIKAAVAQALDMAA